MSAANADSENEKAVVKTAKNNMSLFIKNSPSLLQCGMATEPMAGLASFTTIAGEEPS